MLDHDVLIVGGGLTGLRAAVGLCDRYNVGLISKVHPIRSHSIAAQGGINAPLPTTLTPGTTPRKNTPSTRSRGAIILPTRMLWRSCARKLLIVFMRWNTGDALSAGFLTAP